MKRMIVGMCVCVMAACVHDKDSPANDQSASEQVGPVSSLAKDEFLEMAKRSGCLACHSLEKKVVGPAFNDVSSKYKNVPDALSTLVTKVSTGGKGVWGEVPMPPYSPRVSTVDIEKLVSYILGIEYTGSITTVPPQPNPESMSITEVAVKSGCMACHAVYKKVVGPAWVDVAIRYRSDSTARAVLIDKVKAGGQGNWGEVPMPPYSPRVADRDIERLVDYVLALNPSDVFPPASGAVWSETGRVEQGEIDLRSMVGSAWTIYSFTLESISGDADLSVFQYDSNGVRRLIRLANSKYPTDELQISTTEVISSYDVEVLGYLASDYLLAVEAYTLPEPLPPSADQLALYNYTMSSATLELAKTSGCLACHSVEKAVVGPSFKIVSLRYKGVADIEAKLIEKVKLGGKGSWAMISMPPYSPRVTDSDIATLVHAILFGEQPP